MERGRDVGRERQTPEAGRRRRVWTVKDDRRLGGNGCIINRKNRSEGRIGCRWHIYI